jgi:hypothetical protein
MQTMPPNNQPEQGWLEKILDSFQAETINVWRATRDMLPGTELDNLRSRALAAINAKFDEALAASSIPKGSFSGPLDTASLKLLAQRAAWYGQPEDKT